ncbi:hypothetical protein Ancab_019485, partial [Ancistrocladus abbreviatus]
MEGSYKLLVDIARRKDVPPSPSKGLRKSKGLSPAATPLGSRSFKEVVTGKSKDSFKEVVTGISKDSTLQISALHEDLHWLEGCYVEETYAIDQVPRLQDQFRMEGFFGCTVRPMAGKK